MHFIQNHELREWVKESLRRAIFQKAHALAIQTGCEILIKLQDDSDTTASHQYYGTKLLRQAYHTNRLRMHPDDKMVSGETGMPVISQSTCMQISSDDEGVGNNGLEGLMIGQHGMIQAEYQGHYLANGDAMAQPAMQLREMNTYADKSHNQLASPSSGSIPEVRIKAEKLEIDDEAAASCAISHDTASESLSGSSSFPRSTVSINPKPYQCAVCHKAFRSIQVLQKHTQTFHVRPHHGMGLVRHRGKVGHILNRMPPHEQLHDVTIPPGLPPDIKGFYCMICNQDFPNSSALQDHMTVSHMDTSNDDDSSDTPHQNLTSLKPAANDKSPAGANVPKQALFIAPPDPGSSSSQQTTASSSSVPIFMTLPSASSPPASVSPGAPFCQSSPSGPIFSHPSLGLPVGFSRASTSSGRSKHRTYTKRMMGKQLGNRDIMSAILQTAGPVATHFTVLTASPNFILGSTYITKEQFVAAASVLQDLNLGSLVTVRHIHGRPSVNFVKKPPDDAKEHLLLEANADLCSPSLYEEKFKAATPACVPQGTRDKLISLGLVSRADFK